ncbi:bifunctional phosphoribosylaminoimidazolecarboxamide formyltransferase/IMP cyclohydrolase [Oerskovia turbata]|uniref:Bifunctional purine biosynthesis protein PurH n=1 Tax=Oerskovia turbata TaxID=1713 RepID=A0A4Q1KPM3_9CELL|nr:bifunctional phosphoribosylaminoimidazolecarboxamide formyltransferase/IMP cyclohydrolase [Oerskovia turbata]RXR27348.1 bifunctional phosphoribosylaminoimidazolecarboxamide formyltransferase/IMP cyclohydrolase [Oerskovia turbata]RXR31199.1 bifunctional phosphoribosylaminoimidazolecarboxamide formyltransferase/IMP cyclohydrolase [Oerskovia turbata]
MSAAPTTPETQIADDAQRPVRRALLSVYDKTGLVELATALHAAGVELVSTGSTASTIAAAGVPVTKVEDLTGFPECLEGRVKTLHPRVHAGILADTRKQDHLDQLAQLEIAPFELVVVNLYPFADTVASGAGPDAVIEQIDIGGPSMVRAAAKNHPSVAVVVDPAAYGDVVAAVQAGGFTYAQRKALAAQAFVHTATYDVAVASWMSSVVAPTDEVQGEDGPVSTGFPAWVGATWDRSDVLRYGENPHQRAALYTTGHGATGLAQATQLHGKAMSYNNYVDADAAWRAAHDHGDAPTVAIIKHANPCGVAVGADVADAHAKAHATDPVSAFGGVIATNAVVTAAAAEQIAGVFTEVVVAPGYEPEALEVLSRKKNIRLLQVDGAPSAGVEIRPISGGLLMQQVDRLDAASETGGDSPASWTLATGEAADAETLADLEFAWRAVRAAKSNAILLAKGGAAVGIGMGQVNRVDSCRLSVERANTLGAEGEERARGSVAASDAFFPFADGLQVLLDAGVKAVVQPGGSVRDDEVVAAAQAAGVTLYLTGTRHFAH